MNKHHHTQRVVSLLILGFIPFIVSLWAQDPRYKYQNVTDSIVLSEKEQLKSKVAKINQLLRKKEISQNVADSLKVEVAKLHAQMIENKRKSKHKTVTYTRQPDSENVHLDTSGRPRTSSDLVLAVGFNHGISENIPIEESVYNYLGSRFFELGWAWNTQLFRNSNYIRFKYGASLQFNGLKPIDNTIFVNIDDKVVLSPFPYTLKKSKLSITNLVFPFHLEFGNSSRYSSSRSYDNGKYRYYKSYYSGGFIVGLGVYGGVNVKAVQKLKYTVDNEVRKDKLTQDLNIHKLVYGLSAYIAISEFAIYAKYDLTPIFQDQLFPTQNVSLGVRFDIN